jgi:2-dehydro-3-deoxyphosphogalactonate aldolase
MTEETQPGAWPTRLPLIAILRGVRPEEVLAHAEVLLEAGFDCIEVPTNSPQWERSVEALARHVGDRALVGAGTVWRPEQLQALRDAGGRLMVTPHTDAALVAHARDAGLLTAIGCATPTEAFAALAAGARALKLFPAGALGAAYVAALRSVLPAGVPLFAVGGIRSDNLAEFMRAGCDGAGLGGELYRAAQAPALTREKAQAFTAAWRAIRR